MTSKDTFKNFFKKYKKRNEYEEYFFLKKSWFGSPKFLGNKEKALSSYSFRFPFLEYHKQDSKLVIESCPLKMPKIVYLENLLEDARLPIAFYCDGYFIFSLFKSSETDSRAFSSTFPSPLVSISSKRIFRRLKRMGNISYEKTIK